MRSSCSSRRWQFARLDLRCRCILFLQRRFVITALAQHQPSLAVSSFFFTANHTAQSLIFSLLLIFCLRFTCWNYERLIKFFACIFVAVFVLSCLLMLRLIPFTACFSINALISSHIVDACNNQNIVWCLAWFIQREFIEKYFSTLLKALVGSIIKKYYFCTPGDIAD